MKPNEVEEALQLTRQLLQMWTQLKRFFIKANSNEPLTKDDERQFLEVKSNLAKLQRSIVPKVKGKFESGADMIQNLLRQTISVSHMRNIPAHDRRSLFKDWHTIYITVTRMVGGLEFTQQTGHVPTLNKKSDSGGSIAGIKQTASSKAKKKKSKIVPIVIAAIVVIAAGAVYYFVLGPK